MAAEAGVEVFESHEDFTTDSAFEDELDSADGSFERAAGFGGAQLAMAAPAPAPKMASRVAAPAGPPKKGRASRSKKRKEAVSRDVARGGPSVSQPVFEAQVLDVLELRGPDDSMRGALIRTDPLSFFRQTAARAGRPLGFAPKDAIEQARRLAQSVHSLRQPSSSRPPDETSGRFDFSYPAHSNVDIPSDGAFHSIPLSTREGPCELTYVTVPRLDTDVYRQARLKNPQASPLLPGPAEIYVDGTYVLTASLPMVPGHGEFELGLGVEQAVRCARNVRFNEARSSDKVVATNDLHHQLNFTLANDLDRDVQCEVRERIPVPDSDAEVVIEERNVSPPWAPYDQMERHRKIKGGRCWRVTIPARGQIELAATYVVRIYANHQVVG
ncbi:MAG: DUF4139 domain-containing protein, partial [Myxococcota bacterium]